MIKLNPSTTYILSMISMIVILYLLLTPYNFEYLFKTILGRSILFLLIVFFMTINQVLGIVVAAIILYFFHNYHLQQNQYAAAANMKSPPTTTTESFTTIYENIDIINNKISLEHYLKPKQSHQQIIIQNVGQQDNEPSPYRELLKMFPYF